jgi:hypothetical protein
MSKEWFEVTGKEWKPGAIRNQFLRFINVSKRDDYEKLDYEIKSSSS